MFDTHTFTHHNKILKMRSDLARLANSHEIDTIFPPLDGVCKYLDYFQKYVYVCRPRIHKGKIYGVRCSSKHPPTRRLMQVYSYFESDVVLKIFSLI